METNCQLDEIAKSYRSATLQLAPLSGTKRPTEKDTKSELSLVLLIVHLEVGLATSGHAPVFVFAANNQAFDRDILLTQLTN